MNRLREYCNEYYENLFLYILVYMEDVHFDPGKIGNFKNKFDKI